MGSHQYCEWKGQPSPPPQLPLSSSSSLASSLPALIPSAAIERLEKKRKRTNNWNPGSLAQLFRFSCCGSSQAKEQVRLRNVKNQPTVSKSNLQTDANNSSSVARTNFSKERARLESICEKHLKEKHLMKTYIDQKNREMEALALVLRYMNEELNAFSLPSLRLQLKRLNAELEEVKNHLEQASKENNDLETRLTNLTSAHCEEINKLKECHAAELDQLKESLQKSSLEEITQLKETHQAAEEERRRNFEHQLEDLNSQHEKHKSEMESLHKSKVLELEEKHKLEVEGLEKSFADEVAEINKQSKLLQSELQEKISKLKLKQEELKQQNKEMEENMMKDSDFKIQMAAAKIKDLEKEVDSLKTVMELRNKEVHDLRQESNQLKKLKEELHVAEEKIAVLSARTEDLQAQVNIKSTSERRLTLEHQLLKEWYDKESKVNKRLSMEKEELQWRLQQNTSPDYHSWDESMNKRYDVDTSASRKYYYESSAASSPRVMSKSNPVQIRDPHNRRHQRLSVSDIENKGKNEMSPAVRYRRAGSLSWTVGIDPKEMIDSPTNDETNVKDPIMPESNENRHQTFLLVDDLNDSCESSELKSGDESDTSSVFKSSDIFQLSDLHLSETEQSVKQDASCSSSCNQGSESKSSENCSQEEKTKLSESHRKEKHSTSTPSHSCEDTRLPSLITIKTLEDSHNSSSHYKLSETPSKLRHKNGKSANKTPLPTEISQKTEVRQHCGNTVQELGHSSKQSELDLGEAARKSFEKLNENVVENEFVCKVIPVFTVADANQPSSPKFTSFPEEHSQDSNIDGFDLVCTDTDNNRVHVNDDEQLASLETSSSLPHCCSTDELVSGCFQNVLHDEKNDLNPVALHTRSSMVDAIELDYSARCLTNLEESQHSSITDSNVMEETISESHNSSDYEIVSETEDTTNIRLTSPKWDSAPMSFSDMDHSPVHSRRSEGSGGLLNTTTVLGMKSPTDSSPLQEPLEMLNSSRSSSSSSSSSSEESSPRNSSPLFKIRDAGRESLEDSPCSFAMSPRMSAGEAMVGLPSPHHHDQTRESSNTLLRRTLHEQFIHDKATLNCVDSGGKDSSSEEISQAYFSKPATPESMSQAVAPTDSTNIDLSWSDDDDDGIPSESEV